MWNCRRRRWEAWLSEYPWELYLTVVSFSYCTSLLLFFHYGSWTSNTCPCHNGLVWNYGQNKLFLLLNRLCQASDISVRNSVAQECRKRTNPKNSSWFDILWLSFAPHLWKVKDFAVRSMPLWDFFFPNPEIKHFWCNVSPFSLSKQRHFFLSRFLLSTITPLSRRNVLI